MIYLIHGTDNTGTHKKLHELLAALAVKKPNAEVFRMNSEKWATESWSKEGIGELIGGQGLFERKYIVVFDTLLGSKAGNKSGGKNGGKEGGSEKAKDKEIAEILTEKLDELASSENVFVFLEAALLAAPLAKITKKATKVWKCDEKEEKIGIKTAFNVFALTDAFGQRDRKNLWALYNKAILSGSEPEELHGLLFWQLKSMIIASKAKDAESAGQKPFVWSKSKSFLKNFTEPELEKMSSSLISIYHNARRGIIDFDIALERFILQG